MLLLNIKQREKRGFSACFSLNEWFEIYFNLFQDSITPHIIKKKFQVCWDIERAINRELFFFVVVIIIRWIKIKYLCVCFVCKSTL